MEAPTQEAMLGCIWWEVRGSRGREIMKASTWIIPRGASLLGVCHRVEFYRKLGLLESAW